MQVHAREEQLVARKLHVVNGDVVTWLDHATDEEYGG